MYVCLCNALTTKDIQKAKDSGICRPTQVYKSLGCNMQCGKCLEYIEDILQENDLNGSESVISLKNFSAQF